MTWAYTWEMSWEEKPQYNSNKSNPFSNLSSTLYWRNVNELRLLRTKEGCEKQTRKCAPIREIITLGGRRALKEDWRKCKGLKVKSAYLFSSWFDPISTDICGIENTFSDKFCTSEQNLTWKFMCSCSRKQPMRRSNRGKYAGHIILYRWNC